MNEIKTYQTAKRALEMRCAQMDLDCRFFCDENPLRMVITPYQGVEGQMTLLENLERRGMSPNAMLTMTYDGDVKYEFNQQFTISEAQRKKLMSDFVALCAAWRDLLWWRLYEDGKIDLYRLPDIQDWAVSEEVDA